MNETFVVKSPGGEIEFHVKTEFLQKIGGKIEEVEFQELFTKYSMPNYFHNPNGYALFSYVANYGEYWLDGKQVEGEIAEKIKHNTNFNNELENILKD